MTYVSAHHLSSACPDTSSTGQVQNSISKFTYSLGHLFRRINRRRHLTILGQLSDQQLSDIGLYRDDIFEAKKLGYHRDVTCHLAEIASRRRQNSV